MATTVIRGLTARQMLRNLKNTFEQSFNAKDTLTVKGKVRTAGALASAFGAAEGQYKKVETARVQVHESVKERDAALEEPIALAKDAIDALEVKWGKSPDKLVAAGIPPKKEARQLTAKQKVAAATKRNITREMRGTKGSRQKADIKAQGPVTVTSALASAAPTASTATSAVAASNVAPAATRATPAQTATQASGSTNQAVPTPNGVNPVAGA